MKASVLCVSIAPSFYDKEVLVKLGKASYDDAKKMMQEMGESDQNRAFSVNEQEIDLTQPNEFLMAADGALDGETSDTMFTYVKVSEE